MFDTTGVLFWPVGTGDSTSVVVEPDEVILQVDLRHTESAGSDSSEAAPIVDRLVELLPTVDGRPYLSTFALTHPDKDHIQGFEKLLEQVTIGELWFTPRIFREQEDELCADAQVFREEARRRVAVTIKAGGDPGAGDRVRVIGYDTLLKEDRYEGFPEEFLSIPGHSVTALDGRDHTGRFRAFIHAPFKEGETVGDRNDTSLVLQIVFGDDSALGGVMLWGDHKYPTMRKIIDVSREFDNEEALRWQVMLAAHHCSRFAMYQDEDGERVLKQDLLDDLEALQVDDGHIVSSSASVPSSNEPGDNPPHADAKARYEEIAGTGFLCTHDDGEAGEPLRFDVVDGVLNYQGADTATAAKAVLPGAVRAARGSDAPPADKVGFGE